MEYEDKDQDHDQDQDLVKPFIGSNERLDPNKDKKPISSLENILINTKPRTTLTNQYQASRTQTSIPNNVYSNYYENFNESKSDRSGSENNPSNSYIETSSQHSVINTVKLDGFDVAAHAGRSIDGANHRKNNRRVNTNRYTPVYGSTRDLNQHLTTQSPIASQLSPPSNSPRERPTHAPTYRRPINQPLKAEDYPISSDFEDERFHEEVKPALNFNIRPESDDGVSYENPIKPNSGPTLKPEFVSNGNVNSLNTNSLDDKEYGTQSSLGVVNPSGNHRSTNGMNRGNRNGYAPANSG